ncbi:hypothetical protein B7494_g2962 [Chlorociboria aeruginascens]|nr:hypothetical protein B7494_g2962 [Chlorociboria aeruginascens]
MFKGVEVCLKTRTLSEISSQMSFEMGSTSVAVPATPKPGTITTTKVEPKAEVKAEPGVKIKKEDSDDAFATYQASDDEDDDDMFGEVDEYETVNRSYEGLASLAGVEHFVCQDGIECNRIQLNPDYQRDVVWDESRASLLIMSLLMGYFIPPIIFNFNDIIVTDEKGKKTPSTLRVCVDGKQRLTSVYKFMKGAIGIYDSSNPPKKWYYCHPIVNGKQTLSTHNILPAAVKNFFLEKKLCVYEYKKLTKSVEETMFQLVQRGVALTPAEKMRAMSTPWAVFAKQYEQDYQMIVNLSKQHRASGFRLILTIFTMIQEVMAGQRRRSSTPTLQASPQSLLKVLEDKEPLNAALKLKLKGIFDKYESLIQECSVQVTATRFKVKKNSAFDPAPDFLLTDGLHHVRTFSPLELVATGILVAYHMGRRPDEMLIGDIKELRYYLREHQKDLRLNAQCWATAWEFIQNELPRRRPPNIHSPEPGRVIDIDSEVNVREAKVGDGVNGQATVNAEGSTSKVSDNIKSKTSGSTTSLPGSRNPLPSSPSPVKPPKVGSAVNGKAVETPALALTWIVNGGQESTVASDGQATEFSISSAHINGTRGKGEEVPNSTTSPGSKGNSVNGSGISGNLKSKEILSSMAYPDGKGILINDSSAAFSFPSSRQPDSGSTVSPNGKGGSINDSSGSGSSFPPKRYYDQGHTTPPDSKGGSISGSGSASASAFSSLSKRQYETGSDAEEERKKAKY